MGMIGQSGYEEIKYASFDFAGGATSTSTAVAAVTGKKIRLLSFITANGAVTFSFQTSTGGKRSGNFALASAELFVMPASPQGWLETTSGSGLEIVHDAEIDGCLTYAEVDP